MPLYHRRSTPRLATALLFLAAVTGCLGSPAQQQSSTPDGSSSGGFLSQTSCGAVADGKYINPVRSTDGVGVFLNTAPAHNVVILGDNLGRTKLVRLHGLSADGGDKQNQAIEYVQNFGGQSLIYVSAGCTESLPDGTQVEVGSVLNSSGESVAEALVSTGLVRANTNDSCGGADLGRCLEAMSETNPITAGELDRFLWKPVSDSDGRLAVHTGPYGTTVIVNGERGENKGGGNGYGSLARFSRAGCGYGGATVQVLAYDGIPFTVGGRTSFTIPNPCGRYCVEGGSGQVVACSK